VGYREFFHSQDWNVLIVLDAMRYDYFKEHNLIPGTLTKVDTEVPCTPYWLKNTFPDKYPYTYVSANPLCCQKINVVGFQGGDHFDQVVDAWRDGWDQTHRTVLPDTVSAIAAQYIRGTDKLIIHYMQPHFPSIGKNRFDFKKGGWIPMKGAVGIAGTDFHQKEAKLEDMINAYTENVEIVLMEVNCFLNNIPKDKNVVITADHGELLGEDGLRGHICETDHPILRNVPWFEVDM
jgi:hypothetical protein